MCPDFSKVQGFCFFLLHLPSDTVLLTWKKGLLRGSSSGLYLRDSILLNSFTDEGIKILKTLATDTKLGKNSCHQSWLHVRTVILIVGHTL